MCLAVYVASPRPLAAASGPRLRVEPVKRGRWLGGVLPGEHLYSVQPGCACALLADGGDSDDDEERRQLLSELVEYLGEATELGPVHALVCWIGDHKRDADYMAARPSDLLRFDVDRAWDRPIRLTVQRG